MADLEKIGQLADDLRIDRIFKLAELEKFDDCITKVDWALKNFIRFKIKDKRQIKAKIQSVKEYCLLMTGKDRNNFLKNTPSSGRSPLNQPAPLDKTRPLPEKKPIQVPVVSLSPKNPTVPIIYKIEDAPFFNALTDPEPAALKAMNWPF